MKFHNISFSSKRQTTWKNRSIDYSECEYLPDKNSNSNENMLFLRKTDETIWKPPFLIEPIPFQVTFYFWAIFSCLPPSLPKFQKQNTP